MGLITVIIVATPAALWIRSASHQFMVESAQAVTQRLADYAVAPLITPGVLDGEPAALERLDHRLAPWLDDGPVVEIQVWDADGRIVYSDEASRIGQQFGLPARSQEVLAGGAGTVAAPSRWSVGDEAQADPRKLVGVLVGSSAANGEPLLVEAYYDGAAVKQQHAAILLSLVPAVLLALVVLQLAQLVPAVRLARRIQGHRLARHKLLQQALDASDAERKRIARNLHDEVIQGLAGLAYALEAEENRGAPEHRQLFNHARSLLQDNVNRLREMTSALYPVDLRELGLNLALTRLADPLVAQGVEVRLDLEEIDVESVQSALLYRFAREALANTAKHARARAVHLSLASEAGSVVLQIQDDGMGFDPEAGSPAGHLGLAIMRDAVTDARGSLTIRSAKGEGTTLTATLQASPGLT